MIPQQNLSRLSNRLATRGGRRIPESVLEQDYCLTWFLVALSRTPLRQRLAFKGGTALKACYFGDYRFSEDLDFTLVKETPFETIRQELDLLFAEARRAAGIPLRFAREDRHPHANSYTFYLGYEGPLPATATAKEVKVDITIRERLVFPLVDRPVLRSYNEYTDIPAHAKVRVYSLEEIAAEKMVALMDRARNEPRDLYDAWHLFTGRHVHLDQMAAAVKQKWAFRGKELSEVMGEFPSKETRYRKLWAVRLAAQMVQLPQFDAVFRAVKRAFRQTGLG
ncbi:MAG: nucleotidyl transferase AbiEii/AbiGii toxin family protein [Candidatus Omnitrophica bacterium]|nr:nucleotidyl transferase AbiEii/AbiGii toxin family protein [Candidatus Omnitrophota bacterium]